jgi:putative DNA methylase
MVWDFAEANTLGDSVGAWSTCADYVADCVEVLGAGSATKGHVTQHDAAQAAGNVPLMVSTDPPYYDNIGYAALSDFFYVWLRRTIGDLYRPLCDTVLVPKMPELTASPERFEGDKEKAKEHFESGFRKTFTHLRERLDPRFPLTVYYAFKQDDEESGADAGENGNGSVDLTTGWETLLDALISSGFTITATCPVRASQAWRMVSVGTNALASYIVLACRPRTEDKRTGRAAFIAELKRELPSALHHLQQGNVAPVDFAQAAIGPGMAVFSKYSAVLESNGKPMSVRTALALINGIKDELLGEAVEELDKDTRWATTWFAETGFDWGEAGKANLLANAQATAVNALVAAGIVEVKANQVRLYRPDELPVDWDPATDKRLTVWEMTHHLIRVYVHEKKGDAATAELMRKLGSKAEVARDLAYKLFTVCESKKRSQEAQAYNELVMGWPVLTQIARELAVAKPKAPEQGELL